MEVWEVQMLLEGKISNFAGRLHRQKEQVMFGQQLHAYYNQDHHTAEKSLIFLSLFFIGIIYIELTLIDIMKKRWRSDYLLTE